MVLQSWKSSLLMLKPASLSLMLQVTMKAIMEVYKTFIKLFWWLLLLAIVADYVEKWFLAGILWFLVMFVLFLTVRPSTRRKTYSYYSTYVRSHGLKVLVTYILFMLFITVVPILAHFNQITFNDSTFLEYVERVLFVLWWPLHFIGLFPGMVNLLNADFLLIPFIMPVFVFLMLFTLEDKKGISGIVVAFRRAYTMIFDVLPIGIIYYWMFEILSFILQEYVIYPVLCALEYVPSFSYSPWYILMCLLPFPVCLYTTLYIQQLHKKYKRYV